VITIAVQQFPFALLIATYIPSRTIGIPIVGVDYYVGRLDIANKVLQVIIIGISKPFYTISG
jgi:hypothetical protein